MNIDGETGVVVGWILKIASVAVSFVGGVVTATWIVAVKVHGLKATQDGLDARVSKIEIFQGNCPGKALSGISEKVESIPDKIDEKFEEKFNRVHQRIDEILLEWRKR